MRRGRGWRIAILAYLAATQGILSPAGMKAIELRPSKPPQRRPACHRADPNRADEPLAERFSLPAARRFLDDASVHWTVSRKCFTCHTNFMYLIYGPPDGAGNAAPQVRAGAREARRGALDEARAAPGRGNRDGRSRIGPPRRRHDQEASRHDAQGDCAHVEAAAPRRRLDVAQVRLAAHGERRRFCHSDGGVGAGGGAGKLRPDAGSPAGTARTSRLSCQESAADSTPPRHALVGRFVRSRPAYERRPPGHAAQTVHRSNKRMAAGRWRHLAIRRTKTARRRTSKPATGTAPASPCLCCGARALGPTILRSPAASPGLPATSEPAAAGSPVRSTRTTNTTFRTRGRLSRSWRWRRANRRPRNNTLAASTLARRNFRRPRACRFSENARGASTAPFFLASPQSAPLRDPRRINLFHFRPCT